MNFFDLLVDSVTLTSDLELAVLFGAEHGVSQAEPRQLFAELRQQVVSDEAHHSGQDVQDKAESRLQVDVEKTLKIQTQSEDQE